jgi:gliding motility-associated-like protein
MNSIFQNIFTKNYLRFALLLLLCLNTGAVKLFANCGNINSSFTTSQTLICGPGATTISFTNTSTGAGAAGAGYDWYLNGVFFSTTTGLAVPGTSNISAVGTYNYLLVAYDTALNCRDSATVQVIIRPVPNAAYSFAPNNQCAGTTVAFTNSSTGTGAFTTYLWNFGDATTSTANSPTHVYAAGGTYNATLTVTNGAGCVSTVPHTVTVLPRPVAAISGDDGDGDTQYCLSPVDNTTSEIVTFFNTTTGAVSYSWNFGDGSPVFNTASTASFTHTYSSYGTFIVVMTATGANGCTTSTNLTVVFDKFVSASFIVPLLEFSGCAPHTVTPQNASQNADQYVWNFGDGTPSVTTTNFVAPTHVYQTGGSYTISVVASNSCNSSTSTVGPITVVSSPIINFTATPALGCSPQVVTFGNTTTGTSPTNNYYWDFGNGNTLNGVRFPPPQTYYQGTWTIMLVAGNACGNDTMYRTIVVDTIPTAIMTAVPTVGCTPLTVATTNSSLGGNLSYQWFIDGVLTYTTPTIPNQVFTAPAGNAAVNHTIRLRVINHCGSDDTIVTITVHPLVQALMTPAVSTICEGSTVTFNQTSLGDLLTYAWDFGNTVTSTSASPPAQTYATAGTYTVTLTVTGFCGVSTATATVTVNPIPVAPTALPATICAGNTALLSATAPGGTYQWYNAAVGGVLLQTGAGYTTPVLSATTTYYVQSTALGCTGPRTAVTVTVNPIPAAPTVLPATICAGSTATLNATAPGGIYEWYNAASGGTLLNTGASYTTPPLIISTTYYVQSIIAGCTGPRTAVTVTVNPIPAAPTVPAATICTGNTAVLTATAPGGTYQWYDSLSGGALLNTGVSFTTPVLSATTSYYVQTTVNGCVSPRATVTVTVNPIPVADIVPDVNSGCAGLQVNFNNNSTLGGTYNWVFAGAVPASSAVYSPAPVIFNTSGSNMVYISVNVSGCIMNDTVFINIAPLPVPSFTIGPNAGCSPVTAVITNTSAVTGGDTYNWDFDNGNTSALQNPPSQIYTTTGVDSIYNVQLIISAANGCSDSISHTVTVHPNPVAAFTSSEDTLCANVPVSFTNTSTGASVFQWTFGDAINSALASPSHSYITPGDYTIQLISSTAFACHDTAQALIVIDTVPVADFSASTECLGFATQFTNASVGNIVSWSWNFGDGSPLETTSDPAHTYPANGTYNVTLTVTNVFGCSHSVTQAVIVNPVPVAAFNATTACLGQATAFTDMTTGTPINWIWDFGDASALSNTQNPSHTYATAGSYTVTFIAFGGSGCSDTISNTVIINPVPTAGFTFADVCTNDSMFFNSTSLGAPTTFAWVFDDGFTDNTNDPSPVHVYITAGTYNVVLTVGYASGCTNSITIPVTAFPLTVPFFTSNTPCLNVPTAFTDATTNSPGQWSWNFGDGNTSTLQNPSHTYATAGTFNVELITENVFGCRDSVTINTVVNPLPVAAFAFDTVCQGAASSFTNQSVSSVDWTWDFGDGSAGSTANSPTHTYAVSGTYVVSLIAANAFGCTDTITHSVVVRPNPVASFTATTACFTYATAFTDNSTAAVSWNWNFGDGSAAVAVASPLYIYPAAGTYNATLIVTNVFGCTNTVTNPVIVNPVPVAAFANTTVCLGQSTVFTDQTSGSPIGWTWDFGDGSAFDLTQDPDHAYAAAGNYNVTLIASGGSGCLDTITNTITVDPVPTANFTFASVCANDTMFFNSISLGTPDTFSWDFGDGSSNNLNDPSPEHVFTTAGTYNVILVAGYSSTGCTNSITIPVTVHPLTVPGFTSTTPCLNVATAFTDATANSPTQWSWNFGDGSVFVTTQNPSHVYTSPGTYAVTLVTQNVFGCTDSVTINTVVNPLPVAEFVFDTVCANSATSFTDQSVSAVGWAWDFGDGSAISTNNSPTHVYPGSGTYNVTLIVANVFGCTDTISHNIIVNPNPVSLYSATTACHTYSTLFTDNSTAAVSWGWDFGDATAIDNTQSPSHIFANPGNYNVSLLVTNVFGCTNSSSQTVTVLPQPVADFSFSTVCARQSVQFTDITAGSGLTGWTWDFGDATTVSNLQDPTHIYTLGGTYNVTMIVINSSGCADTVVKPIVVNTVPTPLFTANVSCQGTITSFTDQSSDVVPISSWFYDFDDGNNSLSQNPNYIYAAGGVYDVSLTVTNINGCDSTFILPVTVNVFPNATYSADTVCIGTPTTFTDVSTGSPTTWAWDFGDGSTGTTGPVISHTYPAAGSYLTSLTVSSGAGCTDQAFLIVLVRSDVQADITAVNSSCDNDLVMLSDNSVVTTGFIASAGWDFGDGSLPVSMLNTSHVYTNPGTYVITHVVVSDGGCASTAIDTIVVNPLPVAEFGTANTCQTQPGIFIDNSSGSPATWDWNFGDGASSTLEEPTHVYAAAGNYTATLIVSTAAGCADTAVNNLVVYAQPVASFTSDIVCWNDTTTFINTSTSATGTITSTWWNFGDGDTSLLSNNEHVFATVNDTFSVTLAVITNLGCVDTVVQQAYTHPIPVFNYAPQQTSGCDAFTTTFNETSTVSGGSIVNWLWDFGDGNLTYTQNPTHTYDSAGNFYVSLTVTSTYGCSMSDTLNYPVVVYPHPVAGFSATPQETTIYDPQIQFNNESEGATLWDWDLGDFETSILYEPYHTYPDTGTFMVTQVAINQFGCRDTVQHPVRIEGVTTMFIPNAFTPNGNTLNDVFAPKFYGIIEYRMLIFDRWGNQIFKTEDMNEGWNGKVNGTGAEVQQDVYVYKIFTKDLLHNNHSYVGHVTVVK